jgi:hypothetical protein
MGSAPSNKLDYVTSFNDRLASGDIISAIVIRSSSSRESQAKQHSMMLMRGYSRQSKAAHWAATTLPLSPAPSDR